MPLTELSFLGLVATALITALLISFVACLLYTSDAADD